MRKRNNSQSPWKMPVPGHCPWTGATHRQLLHGPAATQACVTPCITANTAACCRRERARGGRRPLGSVPAGLRRARFTRAHAVPGGCRSRLLTPRRPQRPAGTAQPLCQRDRLPRAEGAERAAQPLAPVPGAARSHHRAVQLCCAQEPAGTLFLSTLKGKSQLREFSGWHICCSIPEIVPQRSGYLLYSHRQDDKLERTVTISLCELPPLF